MSQALAELFSASGAPAPMQAMHLFAKKLDAIEEKLAILRPKAGFDENWLPQVQRANSTPRFSPVTWVEKFNACGGQGDFNRYHGELAGGMDAAMAKLEEMEGKFAPPPPPEEPKFTRAEWEALMGAAGPSGDLPNTKFEYDDVTDGGVYTIPPAPRLPGRPRKGTA
jgi:hypothetical protein